MKLAKSGLLLALSLSTIACAPLPRRDPAFAPVQPSAMRPPEQNGGGIYQSGYDVRLFEDVKARRIGDILTVRLAERTQANKDASLNAQKDTSVSVSAPTIFGVTPATILGQNVQTELASAHEFDGSGSADQSNSLTGNITVSVVDVLPNGDLRVRGEKRVTLNQGDEYIRLSGIVRVVDIDTGNIVSSDKIADATLMYVGDGLVADSAKAGWLTRIFNSQWFPF
ncbi:MAG: flagellar basal body L-ring protein FlgH [Methylobacter sp.]|nr:MAG: flagellar basal body L-ring protein FlgH [Methylobacter sp.]